MCGISKNECGAGRGGGEGSRGRAPNKREERDELRCLVKIRLENSRSRTHSAGAPAAPLQPHLSSSTSRRRPRSWIARAAPPISFSRRAAVPIIVSRHAAVPRREVLLGGDMGYTCCVANIVPGGARHVHTSRADPQLQYGTLAPPYPAPALLRLTQLPTVTAT